MLRIYIYRKSKIYHQLGFFFHIEGRKKPVKQYRHQLHDHNIHNASSRQAVTNQQQLAMRQDWEVLFIGSDSQIKPALHALCRVITSHSHRITSYFSTRREHHLNTNELKRFYL